MTRRYRPRHNRAERLRIIRLEATIRALSFGCAAGVFVGVLIGAAFII